MIIATKPESDGNFEQIPAGTYQAVCYAVWDLGKQTTTWEGQEKQTHKIIIAWEINETMKEGENNGKRFVISKRYTLSLGSKSNLLKDLVPWRGRPFTEQEFQGFDVETVIGANCMLGITITEKDGKSYTNVSSISSLMRGLAKIVPTTQPQPPEWVVKIQAKQIPQMTGSVPQSGASVAEGMDFDKPIETDEIPF